MSIRHFDSQACEKIRRYLDSYISNELLVETNHEVLQHLGGCQECAAVFEGRTRVKNLLQRAVRGQAVPGDLTEKIHAKLRSHEAARKFPVLWNPRLMAVAAVLLVFVGGWVALRLWRLNQATQQAMAVLKIGVDDHIYCAIDHGNAQREFTPEDMVRNMGSDYIGLVSLVKERMPPGYEIPVAHRCRFNDRRFVHMILKKPDAMISLAITRKHTGESFPYRLTAALNTSGVLLHEARVRNWEVAGFETPEYLAFVVSDLTKKENLQIASHWAPPIRDFLAGVDGHKLSATGPDKPTRQCSVVGNLIYFMLE